jgi:Tetracyclin repressor-like, C-terminal domain
MARACSRSATRPASRGVRPPTSSVARRRCTTRCSRAPSRAPKKRWHAPTPKGTRTAQPKTRSSRTSAASSTFLGHDQNFVRLIQREALEDGSRVAEFFGRSVDEAVAALRPAAEKAGISPQRLVLDLAAICWYPFANEHTLMPALGMKARDPAFLEEQKRHLGDLVRAMTRPERERRTRRQRS